MYTLMSGGPIGYIYVCMYICMYIYMGIVCMYLYVCICMYVYTSWLSDSELLSDSSGLSTVVSLLNRFVGLNNHRFGLKKLGLPSKITASNDHTYTP